MLFRPSAFRFINLHNYYEWLTCEQAPVNNRICGAHVATNKRTLWRRLCALPTAVFVLPIVHMILTNGRAGLLKLDWVGPSVISILLCTFFVHSIVKWDWSTTDNPSRRISNWNTKNLKVFTGFEGMDEFRKSYLRSGHQLLVWPTEGGTLPLKETVHLRKICIFN